MLKLYHGQRIRLENWNASTSAIFGTNYGAQEELKSQYGAPTGFLCRSRCNKAWSVYTGSAIVDDNGEHLRRITAQADEAVTLNDGQLVEADGEVWEVVVVRGNANSPRNSDPIIFADTVYEPNCSRYADDKVLRRT